MKLEDLTLILAKIGVQPQYLIPTKPGQLIVPCPLSKWTHKEGMDKHPSCSIRYGNPVFPTWYNCFACKEKGKLWELVHSVGQFTNNEELAKIGLALIESDEPTLLSRLEHVTKDFDTWVYPPNQKQVRVLNDSAMDQYPPAWTIPRAMKYLESRRVTGSMSLFWDLRWHSAHNRIMFPVRNAKHQLVGAVGRAIFDETQPKYYNFFGFETGMCLGGLHRLAPRPQVLVCEGFFDLMNVWYWAQLRNYDTVCTFTARTSDHQAAMLQRLDAGVTYFYDMDEAGNKGWLEAQRMLSKSIVGVRRAMWHDPVDAGNMTESLFNYVIDTVPF